MITYRAAERDRVQYLVAYLFDGEGYRAVASRSINDPPAANYRGAVERIVDGAILVDPTGTCHAVGVILDGYASGKGDSSRGARFNSAVRYHETQSGECLVIIVSEDGMIDLIPRLRVDPGQGRTQPRHDRPAAPLRPWPAGPRPTRHSRRQDHKQAVVPGRPAGHHHR